jgi:hypothetical protein
MAHRTDWAYKQAERIVDIVHAGEINNDEPTFRKVASILRRAEKRGQKKALMGLIDGVQSALKTRLSKPPVATPPSTVKVDRMHTDEKLCWCGREHYCD